MNDINNRDTEGSKNEPEYDDPAEHATAEPVHSGYELIEPEPPPAPSPEPRESVDEPVVQPPAPEAAQVESTFQASNESEPDVETFPEDPPPVDEVWSRWGEWKYPLLWTSLGVALAILIAVGGIWVSMAVLLAAVAFGTYQVVISLEVPVRVTPEQAVKEFYSAAAHRCPNLRRMYILLTHDGKQVPEYTDFAGFRAYWSGAIAAMSHSPTWLVPLEFRVEGFTCRYNEEKSLALLRYRLKVSPRGRADSDAVTTQFEMKNLAVKGPDGQWYLNDGTLPEPI